MRAQPRPFPALLIVFFGMALLATGVQGYSPGPTLAALKHTPELTLTLDESSQTAARLWPRGLTDFSFTPEGGAADGYYRLGDLDIRLRVPGSSTWRDVSSAYRRLPVAPLALEANDIAASDMSASLGEDLPLRVTRRWRVAGEGLALVFTLENVSPAPVQIGGLGMAMVFDNVLTGHTLEEAHEQKSFVEPYVGRNAGYVQVTRLNGAGPALLVLAQDGTRLDDWKPILDTGYRAAADGKDGTPGCVPTLYADCTRRTHTFEGHYAWMALTGGFDGKEWRAGASWNPMETLTLQPGEHTSFGLRFMLSPSIRGIEDTLRAANHPVAIGIPGYVVPRDLPADLFIDAPSRVTGLSVYPDDALEVQVDNQRARSWDDKASDAPGPWLHWRVRGKVFGPARLEISYANGDLQTIHYFVTQPFGDTVKALGAFVSTRQVLNDPQDSFGRDGGILTYDRAANAVVTQDSRVWIAGMSDEGGAGAWLSLIMKQLIAPEPGEIKRFEQFYGDFIDGRLQVTDGPLAGGVRKSLFYYDPQRGGSAYHKEIDWSTWASWGEEEATSVVRSFNYVHVAAAQWVLYRLGRNYQGLVVGDWRDYLERAARTAIAMTRLAPVYAEFGQMEGDVYIAILDDLRREGMLRVATELEEVMRKRTDHWLTLAYPYGSEMPWDSTGQAEVHAWMRYFNHDAAAHSTREVVLAYDPLIPHWGYNGSARRFWDFLYAGKTKRFERQLHHYGSSNNALPLFRDFRRDPEDIHLLRVAYGGLMGSLTNIDEEGFGSAAFHSFPDMRSFDEISGDYGMSFFAHAFSTATYLVDHDDFGWLFFGGDKDTQADGTLQLVPRDSARMRSFIAPEKLWIEMEAGKIRSIGYDPQTAEVSLVLDVGNAFTRAARLRLSSPDDAYKPAGQWVQERGAFTIGLSEEGPTEVTLRRAADAYGAGF